MKKAFKLIPAALALVALASCSNDEVFNISEDSSAKMKAGSAFATLEDATITRVGANEAGSQFVWVDGDGMNVYSKDMLKFNRYQLAEGEAGKTAAAFDLMDGKDGLGVLTEGQENLYGVTTTAATDYVWAFNCNEDGHAILQFEMPANFKQNDKATEGQIPMPFFGKVTVNANGNPLLQFGKISALLKVDAANLPTGTHALLVHAAGAKLSGTFVADLDAETPLLAPKDRFVYGDTIRVNLGDSKTTAAGQSRLIYIPIPVSTTAYNLEVYAVTKDAVWKSTTGFKGSLDQDAWPGTGESKALITKIYDEPTSVTTTATVSINAAQPETMATAATVNAITRAIYDKLLVDANHAVDLTVSAITTETDGNVIYLPLNDGMTATNITLTLPAITENLVIKEAEIIPGTVANTIDATSLAAMAVNPTTSKATSASAAKTRNVTIKFTGDLTDDKDVKIYLPTSAVTVQNASTGDWGNAGHGITAITATEGLTIAAPTTANAKIYKVATEDTNTGAVTINGVVNDNFATVMGAGKVTIGATGSLAGTLTITGQTATTDPVQSAGLEINGTVTGAVTYGAGNTGNVTINGVVTGGVTNNGKGNLIINGLTGNAGDIVNAATAGTITVNTTLAADQTISKIQQKAAKNVSITNSGSKKLTITDLDIDDACSVSVNNATVGTLDATGVGAGKSVPTTLTDATISTIANYAGIGATEIVAYGSAIYAMDDNTNVTIKAYWNGKSNSTMNDGAASKIFTTGQLAALKPNANGYTIDSRVQFMDLNGADNKQIWTGATVAGALTLDCNNVALQDMNLTNAKFKDTDAGIGLIGKITGTNNVTISNVNLQGVYLETTKTVSDAGVLIGSFASTGALTLDEIIISDVEKFSTKGHNVGGLVGSLYGAANSIAKVNVNLAEIGGAYNVGGLVGYYNGAASLTVGAAAAKKANITVAKYTNTGTYSDPGVEQSALYGTFSNVVGGLENGSVTLTAANITATYDFTKNSDNKWTDLQFYGNYKMNTAGTVKRAYYPGNNFVGFMKTGSATITGAAQVNNWTDWYTY